MIGAKMLWVPCLWVTTVTAAPNISLELHPVACMITLLKALRAYDACGIFLAIETSPRNIAIVHLLRADTHRLSLVELGQDTFVLMSTA